MSEKPIRHSEKRIRHATGRDDINRRGGVSRRHLSKRSVDYDQLMPNLRDDVAHAVTEAAVVASQKAVWDRARAITEQGTFLAEKIEGAIHRAQLAMDVQQELDDAAQRLSESEAELSDARARLEQAVQDLAAVGGRVTTVEQSIAILEDELESKISKTEFDSLQGRVQAAETAISQNAEEIALRAYASDVDTLTARISDAEATLALHANQIEARVRQSDFDVLQGRVQTAETQISQHSDLIALKASQEELDTLAGRVSSAESEISVLAGEIELRATKSDVDALANRVSTAEATLQVHADEITSRVMKSDFDALVGRVSAAESAITQTEEYIESEVTRIEGALNSPNPNAWYSSIKQTADAIEDVVGRLDSTNDELWFASIKQTAEEIESVVAVLNRAADHPEQFSSIRQTAAEIQSVVAMLNSDPDAAGQYSSIRQTHEQITSIVAMLESDPDDPRQYSAIRQLVDEIDLRVKADEIITAINLSKEGVRIRGNRVEIDSDTIIAKGAIHAEALNIGKIPSSLPEGAHLFRFDKSLASTRGLRPLPGHVATLRPGEGRFGGAVAVEEGTTNQIFVAGYQSWFANLNVGDSTDRSVGGGTIRVTRLGEHRYRAEVIADCTYPILSLTNIFTWPANQPHTISAYILDYYEAPGTTGRLGLGRSSSGNPSLHGADGLGRKTYTHQNTGDINAGFAVRAGSNALIKAGTYIEWEFAQVELNKPFATSFVDGTRAGGRLSYPKSLIAGLNALTVAAWTSGPPYWASGNKYLVAAQTTGTSPYGDHFALRQLEDNNRISLWVRNDANSSVAEVAYDNVWDGNWHLIVGVINKSPQPGRQPIELYVDGELVASNSNVNAVPDLSNIDETWGVQVGNWRGSLRWGGLIDELLILPYAASEDEIRTWYELDAPFYDAAESVGIDTPEGHVIEIDHRGILMTPAGFPQRGAHLDGRKLGFWDIANVPAVGIGDVRAMAQQLGSQMEYGLLINQGEIRASQAVLEASLVDRSVTGPKIENGTITGVKIAPGGVTLLQLNEFLQIPDAGRLLVQRYRNTTATSWVGIGGSTWRRLASWSVSKRDATNGYLMEVCRVEVTLRTRSTSSSSQQTEARLLLDGSVVATFPGPLLDPYAETTLTANIVLNFRSLSEESHTFAVEMRARSDVAARIDARTVYQNEQLPIRWGRPIYTIDGGVTGGCFTGCEVMCESGCEVSCQSNCQSHCQTGCQVSCQSTCETTSQGGGGCLREGTPVTIWDPDLQVYREVPVEQLRPGMILPGYDPETDTLEHGELVELVDAKFSNRFLRIHTDVGPSVDVTYSQPFDALADLGEGWKWHKMAARFLRPGMKLARPFDEPGRRLATITQVEQRIEHQVHFWNPITSRRSYIAAGYADQAKLPALPY